MGNYNIFCPYFIIVRESLLKGIERKMTYKCLSSTEMEGVVSVFKSKMFELHTTRSWDFMGLTLDNDRATPMQLAYGNDVIVGIFDSGLNSFSLLMF